MLKLWFGFSEKAAQLKESCLKMMGSLDKNILTVKNINNLI